MAGAAVHGGIVWRLSLTAVFLFVNGACPFKNVGATLVVARLSHWSRDVENAVPYERGRSREEGLAKRAAASRPYEACLFLGIVP